MGQLTPTPLSPTRGRRSCRDSLHSGETPRSLQSANITPNQLAVVRTRRCPVSEFFTRPFTPAVSTHEYSLGMAYLINGFSDFFSWRHGFCKGSESYGAFRRISDRRSPYFCPPRGLALPLGPSLQPDCFRQPVHFRVYSQCVVVVSEQKSRSACVGRATHKNEEEKK